MSSHNVSSPSNPSSGLQPDEALLERIRSSLEGLRFGSVQIIVHDSRVVTIERSEKLRLEPNRP